MSGRRSRQYALLVVLLSLLAACRPASEMNLRQSILEWPEQHLLFIADSRMGRVQSFSLGNGAPVPFAQSQLAQRKSVRDLQLDTRRAQLWVLGNDDISVHEARGLALQKRILLDAQRVSALRIEADRVVLLDATGERIGQIDSRTMVASWRLPIRRG